jgi:hypothetical protein
MWLTRRDLRLIREIIREELAAAKALTDEEALERRLRGKTFSAYEVVVRGEDALLRFVAKDNDPIDGVPIAATAAAIDREFGSWGLTRENVARWIGGPVDGLDVEWEPS